MKVSELNKIIEETVTKKIKNNILKEYDCESCNGGNPSVNENDTENKHEVYHIMCDGEPVATCKSEEEVREHIDLLKKKYPGKQFIIEKKSYKSEDHMLDELDSMGEKLENMENTKSMEEMLKGGQKKLDANHNGHIDAQDFAILRGKKEVNENDPQEFNAKICNECGGRLNENDECMECGGQMWEEDAAGGANQVTDGMHMEEGQHVCDECGGELMESGECMECGKMMDEHDKDHDGDLYQPTEKQPVDEMVCDECYGPLDENMQCTECGKMMDEHAKDNDAYYTPTEQQPMSESKKRTIRLTETEMVELIKRIVKESLPGVPGITITDKSKKASKKENDDHIKDTEKKMKDYLSFEGNDNPEFPHQVGEKEKKIARTNSEEQDEEVAKNKANPLNLTYDIEPSKQFKDRLKMSIDGDAKMGNAPTTEKPSIKPSNGADKGKEAKEKYGSSIPTPETGKKIEKQMKDREEDKKKRVLYPKEAVPVNESKVNFSNILLEEMNKMKNIASYNKKTQ